MFNGKVNFTPADILNTTSILNIFKEARSYAKSILLRNSPP